MPRSSRRLTRKIVLAQIRRWRSPSRDFERGSTMPEVPRRSLSRIEIGPTLDFRRPIRAIAKPPCQEDRALSYSFLPFLFRLSSRFPFFPRISSFYSDVPLRFSFSRLINSSRHLLLFGFASRWERVEALDLSSQTYIYTYTRVRACVHVAIDTITQAHLA